LQILDAGRTDATFFDVGVDHLIDLGNEDDRNERRAAAAVT
jgi:hypothetical protein